jgi:hypothetical protein
MNHDVPFRELLYPLDSPRFARARGLGPREFGKAVIEAPNPQRLIGEWAQLQHEPFRGITCDGNCQHGLFPLQPEGAPTKDMVTAALELLKVLNAAAREKVRYPIDAEEWRRWSNPEFLLNDNGVRLEDLGEPQRQAVLALLQASLSPTGFRKARDCMRINAFLGELTDLPLIMNEWSYNFLLFGEPSESEPWGWSLYGHHLILNVFVLGRQMTITPTFMGAEPNEIDTGPFAGTRLFVDEERLGLQLMQSLPADIRERAVTYRELRDPLMPEGRFHPADQRHMGGAFRDNKVIPYEGIRASEMPAPQRDLLMQVTGAFLEYLPDETLAYRLSHIESHLQDTWWSWIGGYGDHDAFYYRVQSPVVMIEFDHHSGVWLNNQQPAKCHIHTVVRTPNGNDYGKDLLKQHYAQVHPGRAPGRD